MLGTVLLTVGFLLLALIAVALITLLSPMKVEARAVFPAEKIFHIRVRFLWGVMPWVKLPAFSFPSRRKAVPKTKKSSKLKIDGGRMKKLFSSAPKLFGMLAKAFKFKSGKVDLEYGLGDPADTGMMYGYMAPVSYASPATGAFRFSAKPNFSEQMLCLDGVVWIVFKPAFLVLAIVIVAWKLFKP